MASSMQPAERRWTSTRKSCMTVLGKVPKPINLPSQKLENHGLDPNVEIVPKGTLTWGTRPLLAASSAWGSSNMSSPRADGNVGSPIHANGRPSSGGSGTRPSTGSSERSSEPVASSWGSSSRPSSASGILPSSHISVAANRPRSAETRPNSSHLSRFAESSADSIAWGAAGTSEKVSEVSRRTDFTLSSGDFPTLGSEKSEERKSQQVQSPKVPVPLASGLSSSLEGTSESLVTSGNGNPGQVLHGNFNSWNADTHPNAGEVSSNRTENWHRDNHNALPLLDANMPARQYRPWHGAQHSNVVLYGGHEAGGFYRPSFIPPGSYHVDPYYPYVPAGPLPNTQALPRAESIPGGAHLKQGEAYRHMPPESYIAHGQSGYPVRPGAYPGPVLYDGCYGPTHTSFNNSSEQNGSTLEIPGQYGVHNQHLSENLRYQPWRLHAQSDGSAPMMTKKQMISGQANETQGQYKVLLKQHGSQEEKDTFGKEHTVTVWPDAQRGKQLGSSTTEPGLLYNCYKQEQTTDEQHGEVSHSHHPNDLVDSCGASKCSGQNIKKLDNAAVHSSNHQNAIVKNNASLMEKVEGLNSKTRVVDVHFEGESFPTKEMRSNQNSCRDEGCSEEVGPANSSSASNTLISGTRNVGASKLNTSTTVIIHESVLELKPTCQLDEQVIGPGKSNYSEDGGYSQSHNQKRVRNIKGRDDHHGKLKFGSYGADETNNALERDSFEKTSVTTGKSGYLLSIPGSHASQVVPEDQGSHLIFNSVSDPSSLKSVDHDAQHANKLKETARRRAEELKKEEEERMAEQKAKALVKFTELNKRASANSKQNSRHAQPLLKDSPSKPDTTSGKDEKANALSETLHSGFSCEFQVKKHPNDGNIIKLRDPADLAFTQPSGTSDSSVKAHVSVGEQSRHMGQESTPEIITGRSALDLQDNIVSRRKQAGYRRRRNITDERNQSEMITNSEGSGNTRCASMVTEVASDGLGVLSSDPPIQASKNNRGPKYKNKLSDTQLNSTHLEGDLGQFDVDSNETMPPEKLLEPVSVRENNSNEIVRVQDSMDLMVEPSQARLEPSKMTTERASSNWKSQPHKKSARNLQSDKANAKYHGSDTVVWAPVKVVNKDGSSEVYKSSASELQNLPDGNVAKARRAEIERYVPKPIAKELSLQGDSHQPSPPVALTSSTDKTEKCELASESAVTGRDISSTVAKPAMNSMNTEVTKQSKHGKTQPSWRQRNSGESPSHERKVLEGSLSSGPSKSAEKTSELYHSRPCDDLQDEPMTTLSIVEDDGVTRQRRQQFKEVRVDGSSYASHSKVLQGEVPNKKEIQLPAPADSGERNPSRNENQNAGSGHMKPHWQPKSQVHSQHYVHGYKGSGGQRAAEKLMHSQVMEKNYGESASDGQRNMIEVDDMNHMEAYRERKAMPNDLKNQEGARGRKAMNQPSKDQNRSINCDLTAPSESASANANNYQEYLGMPRRGPNRGHFPRGEDATYGGSKKAHSMRNFEQHFEHQTGYNKDVDIFQKNSSASEGASEAHRVSSGSRYGMQGRNHSRRGGHFYGHRRGASVRVNGAYDIGG